MTSGKTKIVFFGSGPVSAKSLSHLKEEFEIEAVITKPTTEKEMKAVAGDAPIHCVANKKQLDELIDQKPFDSKLGVLIDFGIIVSQKVIDYFPLGIINSHFSLLPQLRGADPISFAILEGLPKTGVSLMLLVEAMDEGPILACGIQELNPRVTTPELTDSLIFLSDSLLKREIPRYISDQSKVVVQEKLPDLIPDYPTEPSYSRKLTKDDGVLDFNKPAVQLDREIRAFIDWPKSRTIVAGKDVIITQATSSSLPESTTKTSSGKVFKEDKRLFVACADRTALEILKLKPAGKKEMSAKDFILGYRI